VTGRFDIEKSTIVAGCKTYKNRLKISQIFALPIGRFSAVSAALTASLYGSGIRTR